MTVLIYGTLAGTLVKLRATCDYWLASNVTGGDVEEYSAGVYSITSSFDEEQAALLLPLDWTSVTRTTHALLKSIQNGIPYSQHIRQHSESPHLAHHHRSPKWPKTAEMHENTLWRDGCKVSSNRTDTNLLTRQRSKHTPLLKANDHLLNPAAVLARPICIKKPQTVEHWL